MDYWNLINTCVAFLALMLILHSEVIQLQHVIAGVRPSSLSKPEVLKLKDRGVEIRSFDLDSPPAELDAALKGSDTVIFAMTFDASDKQPRVADAAKRVGVKRFIPDDWATPCERGVRKMYDQVCRADLRFFVHRLTSSFRKPQFKTTSSPSDSGTRL